MSVPPYIPNKDQDRLTWMKAFSTVISANYPAYALSSSDANSIAASVLAFETALDLLAIPENRNPVNVADKDVKRNNATILCRQYAQIIRNNSGISDAEKIAAGVRPINPDREPLYAPGTQPSLEIVSSTNGAMTLEYKDMLEMSKSKPVGAVSLQLYVFVGEEMTTDPDAARFIGNYTKNPVIVAFEHSENGQQATFFSRWQGRRGDVGPWSSPISQAIAA